MTRLVGLLLIAMLAGTSCRHVPDVTPPPPADVKGATTPELLPEDLKSLVLISGYESNSGLGGTEVAAEIKNASSSEPITLEFCAQFLDAQGKVLSTTKWSRATLAPEARHHFFSHTSDRGAVKGELLVRRLLSATEAAPQ
jgi:hypothetical protein